MLGGDGLYVPTQTERVVRDSVHAQSSPVYCALEFLFVTEIQKLVVEFYNDRNITILQGIYDGTLFMLQADHFEKVELENYSTNKLYPLSEKVLKGITVEVEITET